MPPPSPQLARVDATPLPRRSRCFSRSLSASLRCFPQETLRERLAATGVINLEGEAAQRARAEAGKGAAGRGGNHNLRQSTLNKTADDESSDFDD